MREHCSKRSCILTNIFLTLRFAIAEQKRSDIYGRAGRKNKFQSKEDRDAYLTKQIKKLARQIEETESRVSLFQLYVLLKGLPLFLFPVYSL